MSEKEIKSVIVPQDQIEQWSEEEGRFVASYPSNYYCINALGDYVFYITRSRAVAQSCCDNDFGKGRYVIRAVKDQKTKSSLESGGLSCYGTATRARPPSRPPR